MGSGAHLQWIWGNTAARPGFNTSLNELRAGRWRSSTGLWYTLCNFYPVLRLLWFLTNQMETGFQGFADPKLIPVRFLCRKLSALDEQTIWSRAQNKGKNKRECLFTKEGQEKENIFPSISACVSWKDDESVDKSNSYFCREPLITSQHTWVAFNHL